MRRGHSTVIVVGGGGMGLATAWRLAKRGITRGHGKRLALPFWMMAH